MRRVSGDHGGQFILHKEALVEKLFQFRMCVFTVRITGSTFDTRSLKYIDKTSSCHLEVTDGTAGFYNTSVFLPL